ncbi:G-protein coupled receptor Mth2-like isoform X2 [Metopolophium dirhodum]|uniref:G-protein coupled receptor Mth2-like isoform X2 n=1 Tax=Metopolophium dirhodum TaxID=44670 RepID=UPI00298FCBC4|nr:G-protein coupled receptor Mth2-like isoform X2 [Metopolophium dirhodum]
MGRRPLLWLLLLLLAAAFANEQCPMNVSSPAPENAYQMNDVLWAGEPTKSYPPAAYRPVQGGGFVLCTCETGACIRKCCPENWAYVEGGKCSALNASLGDMFEVPEFVNENGTVSVYKKGLFHLTYGKLKCADKYRLTPSLNKTDSFRITKKMEYEATGGNIVYTIGMILSLPFLFSTFLVYALIRDLRNLHGKSLMCHVATLMVAYTSLITVQFISDLVNEEWCVFLAYAVQFSFLASFFWLNVMCFDLWWTFSGFRPLRGNVHEHEAKKFIIYSIYAWGSTALITIITYGMEKYLPAADPIRPEFGNHSCWFSSSTATLLYFYGPIGILLLSNLLMFIHTAIMIVKHMSDARVLSGTESRRNVDHEKQRFMLYLKLFIVMGVNWLAEIISWASGSNGFEKYWYVTDIGNSLQGVLIFLIFVCKKRVLNLLNKKLCPRFQLFKTSTASTRTTNSTTSGNSSNTKNKDAVEMSTNCRKTSTNKQLQDFKV